MELCFGLSLVPYKEGINIFPQGEYFQHWVPASLLAQVPSIFPLSPPLRTTVLYPSHKWIFPLPLHLEKVSISAGHLAATPSQNSNNPISKET